MPAAPLEGPRLRFEAPSAEGDYDLSTLVTAVRGRALPIRHCFENLSVHDNLPPGRVVVSFTLRADCPEDERRLTVAVRVLMRK